MLESGASGSDVLGKLLIITPSLSLVISTHQEQMGSRFGAQSPVKARLPVTHQELMGSRFGVQSPVKARLLVTHQEQMGSRFGVQSPVKARLPVTHQEQMAEATEWSKSTVCQIQDGERCTY